MDKIDAATSAPIVRPPRTVIRLIGILEVDDVDSNARLPAKARGLLAYLAMHHDQAIGREKLADLLWERSGPEQSRQSLRQALTALRQALPAALASGLTTTGEHVCLVTDSDVGRFDELAKATDPALWVEALSLYRGPFLTGLDIDAPNFETWVTQERARLAGLRGDLLARLVTARLASSDAARAITAARELVAHDALREDGHRLLIAALAAAGRRAEAIAQFEAMAALLSAELGVRPDPTTVALVNSLRDPVQPASPRSPAPVRASPVMVMEMPPTVPGATVNTTAPPSRAGRPRLVGLALTIVMLVGLGGSLAYQWHAERGKAGLPVVVVKPLEALTSDPEAGALARALTARLSGGLSNLPIIRVRSADATGPDLRVEGQVSTIENGGALVALRLIRRDGEVLQSSEFRAPHRAPADMQDEILGRVGRQLTEQLDLLAYPRLNDTAEQRRAREITTTAVNRVNRGDTSEEVFALFREAIQLNPQDVRIRAFYGNALVAQAGGSGLSKLRQRDTLVEAIRVFQELSKPAPHNQIVVYGLCQASRTLPDLQAARVACEQARVLMPWSARVYKELGFVMLLLGVLDQAEQFFQSAERLERLGTIRWTWAIGAGVTAILKGSPASAASWLDTAAALRPTSPWYPLFAAVAAHRAGDTQAERRWIARFRTFGGTLDLNEYFDSFFPSSIGYPAELKARLDSLKNDMALLMRDES